MWANPLAADYVPPPEEHGTGSLLTAPVTNGEGDDWESDNHILYGGAWS